MSKLKVANKLCKKCNKTKPRKDFYERKGAKKAISQFCRDCHSVSSREYYSKNPEKRKQYNDRSRLKVYSLTLEDYEKLLDKQNGVCAICFQACSSGKRLSVDHNHETGKVRGLLCHTCNYAVGALKENIDNLKNAISYLEENN